MLQIFILCNDELNKEHHKSIHNIVTALCIQLSQKIIYNEQ